MGEYPKHVIEAMGRELDRDGILESDYCQVWFELEKKTIKGIGKNKDECLKLCTSGKENILKSWHDVVVAFGPNTTLKDVKAITSQFGYTILE